MKIQMTPVQKLNISARMIQSSEILQMNSIELHQFLENLSLENPLMEFSISSDENENRREWLNAQDEQNRVYERQERKDAQDPWNLESTMTETLAETLQFQLNGLSISYVQKKTLLYMILNLEPSGYLEMPLEDIAAATERPLCEIESLLSLLQSLEPDGIGARSLQECLCIQLRRHYPEDSSALLIVENYLEMVGKNQMPALARKLHLPLDEVLRACKVIRSLNPRPGAAFGERRYMQYIRPDLIVVKFEGYFDIFLDDSTIPPIHFNEYYMNMLNNSKTDEVSSYLLEKKKQLDWIAQCISSRNETLQKLGHLLVEKQQNFFLYGPGHLKSFSQTEAASILGIHESSVSRAVRDKYLQCSFGVFPLSYFFVQGMDQKDQIQQQIRILIEREDKNHPYSDQTISNLLCEDGLTVSKRLVTKYRNELKLPDASGRREY